MNLVGPRKKILFVAAILFMLIGLCPPWIYTFNAQNLVREKPAGYALIVSPPPPETNYPTQGVKVDLSRLIIQWLVLGVGTALALCVPKK
jgi:hypothetical protein